jgi:hypothetical protein
LCFISTKIFSTEIFEEKAFLIKSFFLFHEIIRQFFVERLFEKRVDLKEPSHIVGFVTPARFEKGREFENSFVSQSFALTELKSIKIK